MRQRNKGDIDFEAEMTEDHTFAMKQGNRCYSPENNYTEQPDLTLGNVDCIPRFPNNISSLLGTTIKNNNANQNTVDSVNYFLHKSQRRPVYYQYYFSDSQSYSVPSWHLYKFNLCVLYFNY